MNDLTNEKDAVFREDVPAGVGEVDGALNAVTKAELLGETQRCRADGDGPAIRADLLDDG